MNKQQAILELQKIKDYAGRLRFNGYHPDFIELDEDVKEAIDMAIEALQDDWIPVGKE